ncbi:MAG: ArsR/SmtB family transcription factor [Halodesulfurarchaeum sp.]
MAELEADEFYQEHAEFCRICGNAKRLKILDFLADGRARTVSTIENETGITQSTLSQHLKVMRDQGILHREKDGVRSYYSIGDQRVVDAVEIVQGVVRDRLAD